MINGLGLRRVAAATSFPDNSLSPVFSSTPSTLSHGPNTVFKLNNMPAFLFFGNEYLWKPTRFVLVNSAFILYLSNSTL